MAAVLLALTIGCGLQTETANRYLRAAAVHQREAEAILARLKTFPDEWQAIFDVPNVGAEQTAAARRLLEARDQDVIALDSALAGWREEMSRILDLDVEQQVKEYVRLKNNAIKCWQEYSTLHLQPLMKAYGGIVEVVAYGRPYSEQSAKAQELAGLASESMQKLAECRALEAQADSYFKKNKIGE